MEEGQAEDARILPLTVQRRAAEWTVHCVIVEMGRTFGQGLFPFSFGFGLVDVTPGLDWLGTSACNLRSLIASWALFSFAFIETTPFSRKTAGLRPHGLGMMSEEIRTPRDTERFDFIAANTSAWVAVMWCLVSMTFFSLFALPCIPCPPSWLKTHTSPLAQVIGPCINGTLQDQQGISTQASLHTGMGCSGQTPLWYFGGWRLLPKAIGRRTPCRSLPSQAILAGHPKALHMSSGETPPLIHGPWRTWNTKGRPYPNWLFCGFDCGCIGTTPSTSPPRYRRHDLVGVGYAPQCSGSGSTQPFDDATPAEVGHGGHAYMA